MREFTTAVGRLVSGHPMVARPVKDNKGAPKMAHDGTQLVSFYGGIAIKKGTETHWNQTEWGQIIWAEGSQAFPNGEFNAPTFAWKIDDGDSAIPNKKGKLPNQREGWPGHWILHLSNGFPFTCYYDGKFNPYESIKNKDEIKTGDYCQFVVEVKGNNVNGPTESPGVYLNPSLFNLIQAGVKIVSANETDPSETFGKSNRALPAGAMVDPNAAPAPGAQQQAPAPGAQQQAPAPGAQQQAPAPVKYNVNGQVYNAEQLTASGWTAENIAALTPIAPPEETKTAAPPPAQTTAPGMVAPAPDFVEGPKSYNVSGQVYTGEQLTASGWTAENIAALTPIADDIPF